MTGVKRNPAGARKSQETLTRRMPDIIEDIIRNGLNNKQIAAKYGLNPNFVRHIVKDLSQYQEVVSIAQKGKLQEVLTLLANNVIEEKAHLKLSPSDKFKHMKTVTGAIKNIDDGIGHIDLKLVIKGTARDATGLAERIRDVMIGAGIPVPSTGVPPLDEDVEELLDDEAFEDAIEAEVVEEDKDTKKPDPFAL